MKGKIFTFIIGLLIGAIIASSGFLIYNKFGNKGNTNNGTEFDPSKMRNGNFTPPSGFSGDSGDFDPSKMPERPSRNKQTQTQTQTEQQQ